MPPGSSNNNPNLNEAILRLVKENNQMLHAMRRNAFLGGLFKLVIYAVLIFAPIWYYMTYLQPTVDSMLKTVQELQGTSASVSAQGSGFMEQLKQLQAMVPDALAKLQQASSSVPR